MHANSLMHTARMKFRPKLKVRSETTQEHNDTTITANKRIHATDRLNYVGQVLKCTSGYMSGSGAS